MFMRYNLLNVYLIIYHTVHKVTSDIYMCIHTRPYCILVVYFVIHTFFLSLFAQRTEIFSGKTVTHDDISYEQACILYNLGELSHVEQFRVRDQLIYLCRNLVERLTAKMRPFRVGL